MAITINGTTGIAGVDGSASTPAVQGTDTNTGIFFPAADTIAFGEGGAEAMRIDSSGRVGVATSTPDSNYTMTVQGIGSGNSSQLYLKREGSNQGLFLINGGAVTTYRGYNGDSSANVAHVWESQNNSTTTERARITSGGNFLVGTTNDTGDGGGNEIKGDVENGGFITVKKTSSSVSGDKFMFFARNGTGVGSISLNGTSNVAYNTSSDYRLKENIAPLTSALVTIAQLKPCTWSWKSDGSNGQGFIAHELQAIVPDCVTGNKDAVDADGKPQYQGVDTSFLVATLTAAIQELKAELDTTKARLAALEAN